MREKYKKIKEIQYCTDLLKTGTIQEIADYFNNIWIKEDEELSCGCFYDEYIFAYKISDMIWIYAFDNDNIELLDSFDPDYLQSMYIESIKNHIIKAISSYEHTDTLIHLFKKYTISELNDNELYDTAVFAENIPVIKAIKDGNITVEILESLIDNEKYSLIDIIFNNGNYIKDSKVIKNYFCYAINNNRLLKKIEWLAERYMPSYSKTNNKEQAIIDFIRQNSDVPEIINAVYDALDRDSYIFDYLLKLDTKLKDITNLITRNILNPCIHSRMNYNDMLDYTVQFIADNPYINYDKYISNMCFSNNYTSELKKVMEKLNSNNIRPCLILNTNNKNKAQKKDLTLLLKYCSVEIVGKPYKNPIIKQIICEDNSYIMKELCKTDAIDHENINALIDMCIKFKSLKCLDIINKWELKRIS